jgi:hypothetical protein
MNNRGHGAPHHLGGSVLRSRADRILAHQRQRFVRDWILALVALALVVAASVLRQGDVAGSSSGNAPSKSASAASEPSPPESAP